ISRRGLTAAGLALTTVGAIGVAPTMNANAAELTIPKPAATTTGLADEPTPPPPLDGGVAQQAGTLRTRSLPGLSAQGLGATPTRKLRTPAAVYAPKGLPPLPGTPAVGQAGASLALRAKATLPAQAAPTALAAMQAAQSSVKYFYASASQQVIADGTSAWLTIGKPYLHERDSHSIGQIAVSTHDPASGSGGESKPNQVLEVGWIVSRHVNKDDKQNLDEPHLFIHYWVDGKNKCYNCAYGVPAGAVNSPGDLLPAGATKRFGIQHVGGYWWVWYDTSWVAYFPDSTWNGKFTRVELAQWYGEVAAGGSVPCSEMGNGTPPVPSTTPPGNPALIYGIKFLPANSPTTPAVDINTSYLGNSSYYSVSPRTEPENPTKYDWIRYGGKGGSCS
ncbi:MAG TPA: neprosin family prolyl endopeptidase, partial [Actinoplanes sp.]|nr:neprosin family prolyl endopeptidase [Actinoplanes sp.]